MLDRMALEVIGIPLVDIIEIWGERAPAPDNLRHHADRKRARTNGWIANSNGRQLLINQARMDLYRLRHLDRITRVHGFIVRYLLAESNEGVNILPAHVSTGLIEAAMQVM